MSKIQSREVSDEFWEKVKPFIPVLPKRTAGKEYKRKAGGGRKPMEPRKVFEGIVYVLRTGCRWKALPKEHFGSSSAIHSYFLQWLRAGFFHQVWHAGLAEYDELEGIAWKWQSVDGAMVKAPLTQEAVGANPTARGKKRKREACTGRRAWYPVVNSRGRSKPA